MAEPWSAELGQWPRRKNICFWRQLFDPTWNSQSPSHREVAISAQPSQASPGAAGLLAQLATLSWTL